MSNEHNTTTSQYWVFTLNNYTATEEKHILSLVVPQGNDGPVAQYLCVGREVGANGTPHLQGYIEFTSRTRFSTAKRHINARVHLEKRKGNASQAAEYCKKDGDYEEVCSYSPRYGHLCFCSLVNQFNEIHG